MAVSQASQLVVIT